MKNALERIANALERISENGIAVRIEYPDNMDKFVTDLPAMKVADAINELTTAVNSLFCIDSVENQEHKEITLETDIRDIDWSNRVKNCLVRVNIKTLQDVFDSYCSGNLRQIRNLGRKGYEEIFEKLVELGFMDRGELNE